MLRRAVSAASGCYYAGHRQWGPCTESLGTESGEVGGADEIVERHLSAAGAGAEEEEEVEEEQEEEGVEGEEKQEKEWQGKRRRRTAAARPLLPPVLPSVAEASLRAERRGGRLILTEVPRPLGIPRGVSRECGADGRLRLRFFYAAPAPAVAEEEDEDEAAGEEEKQQQQEKEKEEQGAAAPPDQTSSGGGCGGANAAGAEKRVQIGAVMGM